MAKRKPHTSLYRNRVYQGFLGDEAYQLLIREDSEIRKAKTLYSNKVKHWQKGDIVNGYKFVKSYEHFNLWSKIDINGKHEWFATFFKNETPAPWDVERFKEGDLAIENLSREKLHKI